MWNSGHFCPGEDELITVMLRIIPWYSVRRWLMKHHWPIRSGYKLLLQEILKQGGMKSEPVKWDWYFTEPIVERVNGVIALAHIPYPELRFLMIFLLNSDIQLLFNSLQILYTKIWSKRYFRESNAQHCMLTQWNYDIIFTEFRDVN